MTCFYMMPHNFPEKTDMIDKIRMDEGADLRHKRVQFTLIKRDKNTPICSLLFLN